MARLGPLEPGRIFANDYRILAPLQAGGMGAVYVAEQLSTARRRALKVMHPDLVRDAGLKRRFEQEARIGGRIQSPHIVDVIAVGVDATTGLPWLAMELLEGEDLAAAVARRGMLPVHEAFAILAQISDALAAAHAADVVHRDLKPDNVFLTASSGVKLLDLGIAKCIAAAQSMTMPLGTPLWMAPEQTSHDAVIRPSADVWALGLVAFWLLSGTHYWHAAAIDNPSPVQLLREIAVDALDPASVRASERGAGGRLPEGFDAWFARAVVVDPARRFADAAEARDALLELMGQSSTHTPTLPRPSPAAAAPARIRSGRSQRVFVGRERELGELHALLDDAVEGRGGVALIAGEPGIGKTRVLDQFASEAARRGARAHWGRCWEAGGAPAFWPWIQALRDLLAERGTPAVQGWLGDDRADLAQLLPELGASRQGDLDDPSARFRLFDAVCRLLAGAAEDAPLVVVLDDLHAADRSSLELLHFVARAAHRMRVLVLSSHRDHEVRASPELSEIVGRIAREGSPIELSRFHPPEVALFVARAARVAPSAEFVSAMHRLTEGNPLFVDAVIRLLTARGDLANVQDERSLPLPDGVRDAIQQRIFALDPATLELLEVASVIGRGFDRELLARAAGASHDEVERALVAAGALGVVVEPMPQRLEFSHVLIRETLYKNLAPSRRAEAHARVFEALEHSDSPPEELAHHAQQALSIVGVERTLSAIHSAAARAQRMLAFEAAVLLLERALAVAEQGDDRGRIEVLLALGTARIRAGDAAGGATACARAAELARALGDPELFARAALAYGSDFVPGVTDAALLGLLNEALAGLAPEDGSLRARVLARKAAVLQPAPDPLVPIAIAREAIAMARRLGEEDCSRHVLTAACSALVYFGDPRERAPLDREMVELATRAGDRLQALIGLGRLELDQIELGDRSAADARMAAYAALAQQLRQPRYQFRPLLMRSLRAALDGRPAQAEAHIAEARAVLSRTDDRSLSLCLLVHRLSISMMYERTGELLELVPEVLALIPNTAFERLGLAIRAQTAVLGGDLAGASALFARLDDAIESSRDFGVLALLVRPSIAVGDRRRLERLHARLSERADNVAIFSSAAMAIDMPFAWMLGAICHALGRPLEAEQHYERALEVAEGLRARPLAAKIRHDWARLLRERGAEQRAEALSAAAREASIELGMTGLAARIEREPSPEPPARTRAGASARPWTLALEGEFWTVTSGGKSIRLKDSRGLRWLADLVQHAGHELHVLTLVGADELVLGDAGEALDREAIVAYRRRLEDLRESLEEAQGFGDLGRAARAREEIDALASELARGVGLGGRARKSSSPAERARVNVQRRIRDAIGRIERALPELGRHLRIAVKTGTYCRYDPHG